VRSSLAGRCAIAGITPADVDLIILAASTPMTCLQRCWPSSPQLGNHQAAALTSRQLAPGCVWTCHRCPVHQRLAFIKAFFTNWGGYSLSMAGKTGARDAVGDGAGDVVMQATGRDRLLI